MSEMFEFDTGGIGVMPDPEDNPNNHMIPHHEASTMISFQVFNVGDTGGRARVGVEIDDIFFTEWESEYLESGESEVGYVSLGRLAQGSHTVLIYVNPGAGTIDHQSNTFDVE